MFSNKEINEVARLSVVTGLSNRAIGRVMERSDTAVGRIKKRLRELNLKWPETETIAEELQAKVYPNYPFRNSNKRPPPLEEMHTAMQFKGQQFYPLFMAYVEEDPATALGKTSVYGMYREYSKSKKLSQLSTTTEN